MTGVDVTRIELLNKYKAKLKTFYDKLLVQQTEIEEFIQKIEDPKLREIFRLRYIDQLDWYKISIRLKLSGESTARMKHDRYLENFQ